MPLDSITQVLDLGMCGRCLCDRVLSSTIATHPASLPALTAASFSGAFRISDSAVASLTSSAPTLSSLTLRHCPLLTSAAFHSIASHVGASLKKLSLEGCSQLNAEQLAAAVLEMPAVESLALVGQEELQDCHVESILIALGPRLGELNLAKCR